MTHTATVHNFEVQLSDVDRHVYESLSFAVARHPSESSAYLLTRVLAYCFEYTEALTFSRGLADPDQPALWAHDQTGRLTTWIEIGAPSAERLHRASKNCPNVAVYCHKDVRNFLEQLKKREIFKAEEIAAYALPTELLVELERLLERRMKISVSRSDAVIYLTVGTRTLSGTIAKIALGQTP